MIELFQNTFAVCCKMAKEGASRGLVEPIPESLQLVNKFENLVSLESKLINPENLETALSFMKAGGNVLMVQNHTSGADTYVWRTLVNRYFSDRPLADEFAYMSGHIVNIYPMPLLFSGTFRRIQIYSERYKQITGNHITHRDMVNQNCRALRALYNFVKPSGKMVGLYPEGGRGEGALKFGDPNTAIIPQTIAKFGNFMILPTYVNGATSILPVKRGENEFNEFLNYIQPGTADITCGTPYYWADVDQSSKENIHATIMHSIAALAPTLEARGPWTWIN
jgi:1-acyl-sn-glycerol-3-phosphate acyltransferase